MTGPVYIDTTAVVKIVFEEPESDAVKLLVDRLRAETAVYTSEIGMVELQLLARCENVLPEHVRRAAGGFDTLVVDSETFRQAMDGPGEGLGVVEALHLAVARRYGCDTVITYSEPLARAARAAGVAVLSPGPGPEPKPLNQTGSR